MLPPDAELEPAHVNTDLVSVSSFNMLADVVHCAGKPKTFYDRWANRWPVLLAQLEQLKTDIVCLQEVDEVGVCVFVAISSSLFFFLVFVLSLLFVFCSLVWFDLVWFGFVSFGFVWFRLVSFGFFWFRLVRFG